MMMEIFSFSKVQKSSAQTFLNFKYLKQQRKSFATFAVKIEYIENTCNEMFIFVQQ